MPYASSSLVFVSVLLLSMVCSDAREVSVSFDLVHNFTTECAVSLSANSTAIRLEYREINRADEQLVNWTLAEVIAISPGGSSCGVQKITVDNILFVNTNKVNFIQFRLLQLEHGGGSCNCWGVSNFTMAIPPTGEQPADLVKINLTDICDQVSLTPDSGALPCEQSEVMFCAGSASRPRGLVTALYQENSLANIVPCSNYIGDSRVSDPKPSLPSCNNTYPNLEVSFHLDMLNPSPGNCRGPGRFDEGIELAIGGNGRWTPLSYTTTSVLRSNEDFNINIGNRNEDEDTVEIRGYRVPYYITDESRQLMMSISVCGPLLQDGIQLRWLQTASFVSNPPVTSQGNWRDLWTLTDIKVTLNTDNNTSTLVLSNAFNDTADVDVWGGVIRNGMMSPVCSDDDNRLLLLMGSECNTPDCGSEAQSTASRQVSTEPLTLTSPTEIPSVMTTASTVPPMTTMTTTTMATTTMIATASTVPTSPPMTTEVDSEIADQQTQIEEALDAFMNQADQRLIDLLELSPNESVNALRDLVADDEYEIDAGDVTIVMALTFQNLGNETIENPDEFGESIHTISDGIIESTLETDTLNPDSITGGTLLSLFEQLNADILTPDQNPIGNDHVMSRVMSVDLDTMDEDITSKLSITESFVMFPRSLLRQLRNRTEAPIMRISSTFYQNMSGLLPGHLPGRSPKSSILASPVLSSTFMCNGECPKTDFPEPVRLVFSHPPHVKEMIKNDANATMECVFWDYITVSSDNPLTGGRWSTRGCINSNRSNATHTVCECNHLTNFAILLSAQSPNFPESVGLSLAIIGYIGVSLSVLAMIATIFTLLFMRSLWSMRNFIHINLCVSLILAQLTFVVGVTPHEGEGELGPGCRTAAVLMHYLFLVSFMWMLMEGVVLYIALVKVFVKNQIRYMIGFFISSYGAPLLYMVLCVPLGFAYFPQPDWGYGYSQTINGTETVICWLNPHHGFVWSFIVPVILTILINIGFFIMALVIMYRHSGRQTEKTRLQKARYWLKSSISLVTVMGITWIIGVLVLEVPALIPLAYIFTIFVAFQGVAIFIIFVPLSKQVREAYKKWWKVKVAESEILSKHFGEFQLTQSSKVSSNQVYSNSSAVSNNYFEFEDSLKKLGHNAQISSEQSSDSNILTETSTVEMRFEDDETSPRGMEITSEPSVDDLA